jgi:hypothetical protein
VRQFIVDAAGTKSEKFDRIRYGIGAKALGEIFGEGRGKHRLGFELKMWVDKQTRVPVTIEAYAASGLLIKTLHYSGIKDFGHGIVRPAMLETDSPLYKGYKSVMLFDGIRPREFADEVFTLDYLSRVGELRQ